ncbi:MAG: formyltetrahydrofolate deformylase [Candidatus Nitrosomirales archaeon]|jgi:formyltetrahydrofolate deformylase
MARNSRILAEITVVGPDRKGVVAGVTNYIFESQGNIEKINQNVIRGLFGMQMEASFQRNKLDENEFRSNIKKLGKRLGMEIKVHFDEPTRPKNMAVLVTKEPHCLETILDARRKDEIRVNIPLIVGSEKSLKSLASRHGIPFFSVEHKDQAEAEEQILRLVDRFDIDFIVLARYMRILSPNFVWRYPNRIINIHPSLLPAFAGAYAYVQAYERGAQIVGCTAHFVTEDLDKGPIIWQDSFRVEPNEDLNCMKKKGQQLEARTLLNGVKLYLENKLEVYWGKVHFKKLPKLKVSRSKTVRLSS